MARPDPDVAAHREWIGFVGPTGLVVSPPALVHAGIILKRSDAEGQRLLEDLIEEVNGTPRLPSFRAFAEAVLGWSFSSASYDGTEEAPLPPELVTSLGEPDAVLRPDYAVRMEKRKQPPQRRSRRPATAVREDAAQYEASAQPWQLLVHECSPGEDFDRTARGNGLDASPHGRMERLLRQSGAPAGLLFNGDVLRLISAPKGESSGWLDFRVRDMRQAAGRPICTAMRELLSQERLLTVPKEKRLAALLADSRKYQNEVSERLAEQVLHALYELVRGFQAAQDASKGELLQRALAEDPDDVYRGLLTVVLRLVFLLYAEERDLLPQDEAFLAAYSIAGLYQRLREDAALNPDTMDQRYGAWAQLLALSRMVHDGAKSGEMRLPPRHGALFDPDRYRFLEGRDAQVGGARQATERIEPPLVPDGTIHRVLEKLIVLDGERISYRALDVEHIGSVYETMMGFRLETTTGWTAAIKADKKGGAPAAVDLTALLAEQPGKRAKWLLDKADRKITDRVQKAVAQADTLDALHAALDSLIDRGATPDLAPAHAMVLQPSDERRKSGSHYTPRELTEPIVRRTLGPVLAKLSETSRAPPTAEQILDLTVCDPAMGSGAFLVETCRQLGDALVEAWRSHGDQPTIPPDEDEVTHARRLVAQRCLYGVDRNPAAVDLAKLSLWLVTLAKDHPLTFLDHALRHGDSLVGLTRTQIQAFDWRDKPQRGMESELVRQQLAKVSELRQRIRTAGEDVPDWELRQIWDAATFEVGKITSLGDLVLTAFFDGKKVKDREERLQVFAGAVLQGNMAQYEGGLEELRFAHPPLAPFHWEIEFPEVFERENPGFDGIVGNPPFAGKNTVAAANPVGYPDWLKTAHPASHGNADLVAHFFRRAFDLLRDGGALGLIATNTIAQGDTRSTGLRWICEHGGEIYHTQRRVKWPGLAAVVVSVLHIHRGAWQGERLLDDAAVPTITAFLFHDGGHRDPARLKANAGKSFQGSIVLGMGFTFDDTDKKGVATPLAEMRRLIEANPRNREVILPYIGGTEVNASPTHAHHRYVINFRDWPLRREKLGESWHGADGIQRRDWRRSGVVPLDYPDPVAADWPELLKIVEERVKPQRDALPQKNSINREAARVWWRFLAYRLGLHSEIAGMESVVGLSRYGQQFAFTFLPAQSTHSDSIIVFPFSTHSAYCALQSRPHEIWARFLGSSMKDDLRYTPSDCFETFPFPRDWDSLPTHEAAGKAYYDHRAALMVKNNEGMTQTYNRFHDPYEDSPEITQLRSLHAAMDRAVLHAYGWTDIPTDCEFLLDYEIDEETWGKKKKPYRYRWPDAIRDEVLARLLALNATRAAEESGSAEGIRMQES